MPLLLTAWLTVELPQIMSVYYLALNLVGFLEARRTETTAAVGVGLAFRAMASGVGVGFVSAFIFQPETTPNRCGSK